MIKLESKWKSKKAFWKWKSWTSKSHWTNIKQASAWSKQILKDVFNTFKDQIIIMMKDLNLIHHLFVLIMISKAKQSKPLIRKYEYEILNIRFHLIQHHWIIQRTSQHHSRYKQITSAYNFIKIKLCNIKNIKMLGIKYIHDENAINYKMKIELGIP